ncbi:hypothetical protein REPUB_Repub11eG0118300 [Reevesia pubescens]
MALTSKLTLKQLQEFHNIDRKAYSRLVIGLGFDPSPSMKIVAFWNFLERKGFRHFVKNLQELPDTLLFSLAKEAIMCLECLYCSSQESFPWVDMDFPEMRKLVGQDILLGYLFKNKESAKGMIEDFVKDVCQITFIDIVQANLASKQSSKSNNELQRQTSGEDNGKLLMEQEMATMTADKARIDKEDRTLFVTFAKGHPVSKQELHGFIDREFGKCVEAISMDQNPKPLFACVVLRSLSDMSRIIGGKKMVKLFIKGKQVRARRDIPKTVKQSQYTAERESGFPIKTA